MTITTFKLLIFRKYKEFPKKHEMNKLFIINGCNAFLFSTYVNNYVFLQY